jgi:hypothetical protein
VAADRRSVLARYGTKFQALAGAGGQRTEGGGQRSATRVPPVPSGAGRLTAPPLGMATATMEEAWAALNETQSGKAADVIEKVWFDTIARLFPNKSNTDLKPHEWGKLKAEFKDEIPM